MHIRNVPGHHTLYLPPAPLPESWPLFPPNSLTTIFAFQGGNCRRSLKLLLIVVTIVGNSHPPNGPVVRNNGLGRNHGLDAQTCHAKQPLTDCAAMVIVRDLRAPQRVLWEISH